MTSTVPGFPLSPLMGAARLFRAALLALLFAAPGRADAALVRWYFAGRVVQVTGDFGGSSPAKIQALAELGVTANATISGSFAFESTTPDSDPSMAIGEYLGTISDLQARVGTYAVGMGTGPAEASAMIVGTPAAPFGPALFTSAAGADSPRLAASGLLFALDLAGGSLPIATDALPTTPPDPALAGDVSFALVSHNEYVIVLQLDSLGATAPAPVSTLPPAGLWLVALALGATLVALQLQTGRMPRFFGGSGSSGRAR